MKKLSDFLLPTDEITVTPDAPHHANQIGFFEKIVGKNNDMVVLRREKDPNSEMKTLFVVSVDHAFLPDRIEKDLEERKKMLSEMILKLF